ncbi:cytoplasmic tyrosine-protein kinase BMX-like [Pezoporus flaviventris]|uniref:cytoplasmic tyrosine-protein kinase BMX-like n=1 Tax=Pezoporus flaviventris TaxID=889875 RepID=UPI002AB0DDFA|nr:cytoplasmic tyrosine-protein kinase BMX-like [Pezoporus flaviventris]
MRSHQHLRRHQKQQRYLNVGDVTLGKHPYKVYDNMKVIEKVFQGYRLYRPQLVPDIIYQIMYNCWHELPEKHLAFYQLLSFFEALREDNRS